MSAGDLCDALLRVADQLCAGLGYPQSENDARVGMPAARRDGWAADILSAEDEMLATAMRQRLAKVAKAVGSSRPDVERQSAVDAALDGTEMVIRGELARGNADQLPSLLPSFVFLVTLPIVEQDEALHLSQRTSELIEGAFGA